MKVMTKNEIMKHWNSSKPETNEQPCCPSCRDNMEQEGDGKYGCNNVDCRIDYVTLEGRQVLEIERIDK